MCLKKLHDKDCAKTFQKTCFELNIYKSTLKYWGFNSLHYFFYIKLLYAYTKLIQNQKVFLEKTLDNCQHNSMLQLYFQKLTKFLIILKNNLKLKFRYLKENIVTILRK